MSPTSRGSPASGPGFTAEEKAAIREAARERRARSSARNAEPEALERMDGMDPSDRRIPERVHAILRAEAPEPTPRIGYGGPAHASVEGEVVCVFRGAWKFKTRYATLGFGDAARLDEGNLWATDFALREIPPAEEARIVALVRKATRPIGRPASSSKPG